jgi:SAM-dependent methyltransferase
VSDFDPDVVTQVERDTWNRVGGLYSETLATITERGAILLIEAAGIVKGQRVLDLGCGPGNISALLARTGATVVGVDLAVCMVEAARSSSPGIEFYEANAEDLPFEDSCFEAVVACYVLHHLARPDVALRECYRVLVPGGRLAFVHPQDQQSMNIFFSAWEEHNTAGRLPHGPLSQWTGVEQFEELLVRAGFTSVEVEPRDLPLRLRDIAPILDGCRRLVGLDRLPPDLQRRIEEATLENAKRYERDGVFVFKDAVLVGRVVKPPDSAEG